MIVAAGFGYFGIRSGGIEPLGVLPSGFGSAGIECLWIVVSGNESILIVAAGI